MDSGWTVFKVGGSLLDLPAFPELLLELLDRCDSERPLLIVGGGGLVNALRRLDEIHRWPAETTHRLAITMMGITARLLAETHPRLRFVRSLRHARTLEDRDLVPVLDCEHSRLIDDLPASWDITSDSIAARITCHMGARRLVLLKSVPLPSPELSLRQAAELGLVDPCFPEYARAVPSLRWCDMRSQHPTLSNWQPRVSPDRFTD